KKDPGCGLGITPGNIPMSEKFWDPVQTKIWLEICHKEFDGSFMVYLKNKGLTVADITNTEIAAFIIDQMGGAAYEDIYRIAWFNDTAAANVSGSGTIKNGVSVDDYNIING